MFHPEKIQQNILQFWREKLLYQGAGHIQEPKEGLGNNVIQGAGIPLRGWIDNDENKKALVFFGGNMMALHKFRHLNQFKDKAIYLFPYRGYEGQQGVPKSNDLMKDALCVVQEALKHHPDGVSVVGISLGTGFAMKVASQVNLESLILITPYDDITTVMKPYCLGMPVNHLLNESLNSKQIASQIHCPVSILKAEYDNIVPAQSTDTLIKALTCPVHVETYPETHMGLWKGPSREWTLDFIRQRLNTVEKTYKAPFIS